MSTRQWAGLAAAMAILRVFSLDAAFADQYHYKGVLIGERAAGLGGAFVAISDDPSGMYYNPAGLVFSMENYFSLSANAFSTSSQTFKDIVPGQDYTYTSQAFVPAFFGFTQSYGKHKFGFAVIVPDSELIDQDNTLTVPGATDPGAPNTLKRRFFQQDITYLFGPAYAHEISHSVTFGFSIFGFYRTNKWIDNQLILYNPASGGAAGSGKYFIQNSFLSQSSYGVTPKVGFQYMPSAKLSFGFTGQKLFNMGGSATLQNLSNNSDSNGIPVTYTGAFNNDATLTRNEQIAHSLPDPIVLSGGAAYFFDKANLLTVQFDYYTPVGGFSDYPVAGTYNWAVGGEHYLSESWALRAGAFSNRARTAHVSEGVSNQPPHIDMIGATGGLTYAKPGTSLTVSTAYSSGSGQGEGLGGLPLIQTVNQSNLTVFLTGSYQL